MWVRYSYITLLFISFSIASTTIGNNATSNTTTPSSSNEQPTRIGSKLAGALDGINMMIDGFLSLVYGSKDKPAFIADLDDIFRLIHDNSSGKSDPLSKLKEEWKDLAKLYTGVITCIVIGVLLFIVMPIVGMCCCCCRSCNRCGGATKEYDPKSAKCKRVVTGFMFLVFSLGLAGCTVIWFMNAEGIIVPEFKEYGVITHLQKEINSTIKSVSSLYKNDVRKPVRDAADDLKDILTRKEKLSEQMKTALGESWTNLTDEVASFDKGVDLIRSNITAINSSLASLETALDNSGSTPPLPVNSTQIKTIRDGLHKTQQRLGEIPTNLTEQILNSAVEKILNYTHNASGQIDQVINSVLKEPNVIIQNDVPHVLGIARNALTDYSASDYYGKYFDYGRISLLVIGGIMGMVVLLFLMGMLCGCGERAGPGSGCCNKGAGAKCILAGIGIAFIFYSIFMLLTIVWFVVGSGLTTHGCWFLEHPEPFMQQLKKTKYIFHQDRELKQYLTYVQTYSDCLNNRSLEESLSSIPEIANFFNRSTIQDELKKKIGDVTTGINVAFPDISSKLDALKEFKFPDMTNLNQSLIELKTEPNSSVVSNLINNITETLNNAELLETSVNHVNNSEFIKQVEALFTPTKQKSLQDQIIYHIGNKTSNITAEALDKVMNGKCSTVAGNVKGGVDIVCDSLVRPLNMLWFSAGGFVALVIFAIIFGFCLSNLYRRENPYEDKKRDEDEERDNRVSRNDKVGDRIPLQRYDIDGAGGFTYANQGYVDEDLRYPHQHTSSYNQPDPFTYNPPPYHAARLSAGGPQRGTPRGRHVMHSAHPDARMY